MEESQTQAMETAVLAGGCFWCLEAAYQRINGVSEVVSGYAGGHVADPTYEQVSSGTTGHAESVHIAFDPKVISYEDILDIFFAIHDPTTKDRQGADVGTQYRSVIFYSEQSQKHAAVEAIKKVSKLWPNPVITEVKPLDRFYRAEEYHQDYYNKNPQQGYCQVVINPKLAKLREKFSARLREV
jgi:peptide-methionine (S)-S-oxide reductase